MSDKDTIVALATPPGQGGIGVIRVSGTNTTNIACAVLGQLPKPRYATHTVFLDQDGSAIDDGLALYFPAPHSFTGDDVLELQGHGGPVVLNILIKQIISLGARLAKPGEFSQRAFLNNKIDLVQAEAIADLITAGSEQAVRAARQSLQGVFSKRIHALVEQLTHLRMYIEATIDFPEEEIDFLSDTHIQEQIKTLEIAFEDVLTEAKQGQLLREGMRVVLIGQPNVGKSSVLNKLAGQESAIVTDIPGTTRDVLREEIQIDGMPLHVIDTAGLRDSEHIIEKEGMRRTWKEIENADLALLVIEDAEDIQQKDIEILKQLGSNIPVSIIRNKIDLSRNKANIKSTNQGYEILLSAKTGEGTDLLREHLKACMGYSNAAGEAHFIARQRHMEALYCAEDHLKKGVLQLRNAQAGELLAEELRLAQQALGEITGEVTADDLLGAIFSSFCIGK